MRAAPLLLLAGLLFAGNAAAASFVVLDDARYVAYSGGGSVTPAPGASLFDASVGSFYGYSQQTSTLNPDAFTGSGSVFSEFPPGDNVFDVLFTVDSPVSFSLTGQLSHSPETSGSAFLSDSTGVIQVLTGGPGGTFSLAGSLSPGTQYRLIVAIQGGRRTDCAARGLLRSASSRSRSRTASRLASARSRESRQ